MGCGAARLVLGTAQFGLAYGATHAGGRVPEDEARRILDVAQGAWIGTIDTAAAYGDAEEVLGRLNAGRSFSIVTKTAVAGADIETRFKRSLELLNVSQVEAVLVHAARDLLGADGAAFWKRLEGWRREGLVRRIGVSVYDRIELDAILSRLAPDLVQLPMNVLDQRLLADGSAELLHSRGVAIHVRSAFLQGLLLTGPAATPPRLRSIEPHLARWRAACAATGASQATAALGFLADVPGVERIVIGVQTANQLREIIAAAEVPSPVMDWARLAVEASELVDPRRWPQA
jgi:D-threo-aldose 1-dehydrogenase